MEQNTHQIAVEARRLIRSERTGILATHGLPQKLSASDEYEAEDWPYASLVEVACDLAGRPLLLLSGLAVHTQNILRDSRVSLLFDGTRDSVSPLTDGRVTLAGRAEKTDSAGHRSRFMARHPKAATYADFADFGFWRVEPVGAHFIAGFGRINSIPESELVLDHVGTQQFADIVESIVEHMNTDHRDAIELLARNLFDRDGSGWEVSSCDPEGVDLRCGDEFGRLEFEEPVFESSAIRKALAQMTQRARSGR